MRELTRLAEIHLNAVRREIANLVALGLIHEAALAAGEEPGGQAVARSKYFRLAHDSLLFPELKALLLKAQLLEEQELIDSIKRRGGKIAVFILTGWFTQATDVETDILLVGALKPVVIAKLIRDYEHRLQRSIRYTMMKTAEFQERREIGDKFLYGVFEAKHITAVDELHLG